MALKPNVLNSMLLQFRNKNKEINLITSIFDIRIEYSGTKGKLVLDFDYDLPKDYYTVIIAASNDPNFNKASSSGSLGYWFSRIIFKHAKLINTSPLIFTGKASNIKKNWFSVL